MALSGSKTVTATKYNKLVFSWTATQSVSGNYSNVSWKLKLTTTGSGEGHISASAPKKYSVTVNGTSKSGTTNISVSAGGSKTLASGTVKVNHNSNGTKAFSVSFSQEFNITFSGSHIGTVKGSASFTLNTIPRASSMSVPNITIGSAGTITVSKASSSFSHTITATFGSYSKTIVSKGTGTSYSFTPPMEWCNARVNGTSDTVTYKITTYNGSTAIGTKTYTATLYIPSSVVPTISGVSHSEASLSSGWSGVYVKTKSKIQFRVTCVGAYGSTIKSIITKFDGQTLSGTPSPSANCNSAGSVSYTVTVTDSRGRTASKSGTITVMDYSPPQLINFSAFRCNENGKADDNGERLSISKRFTITQLNNKNTNKWKIEYKQSGASSYSLLTSGSGYSINDNWVSNAVFNVDKAYMLKITVEDSFHVIPQEIKIPTAFTLVDYNNSGKGISFGKVAENDIFDVGLNSRFRKTMTLENGVYMNALTSTGNELTMFFANKNDEFGFGYDSKAKSIGTMYFDGNDIRIRSNKSIIIDKELTCTVNGVTASFGAKNGGFCHVYSTKPFAINNDINLIGNAQVGTFEYPSGDFIVRNSSGGYRSLNAAGNSYINLVWASSSNNVYVGGGSYQPDAIFLKCKDNTNVFGISNDGNERMYFLGAYNRTYSGSANVVITSAGTFGRHSSSSRKYKTDIISINDNIKNHNSHNLIDDRLNIETIIDPNGLYQIPAMQYKYIDGYLSHEDVNVGKDLIGIMAEDVAEFYPIACIYDENGNPEAWNSEPVLVGLLYLVQEQKKEIEAIKQQLKGITK